MGFNTQNGLFRPSSSFFLRPSYHDTFSSCSHFASSIVLQRYNTFLSQSTLQLFFFFIFYAFCYLGFQFLSHPFACFAFSCFFFLVVVERPLLGLWGLLLMLCYFFGNICNLLYAFANFKLVGLLFVMPLLPCVLFLVSVVHIFLFLFLFFLG